MFTLFIIFSVIAIILCFLIVASFILYVIFASNKEIGYKPIKEIVDSSYLNNTSTPANQQIFIKNADHLLHGNQS